MSVEVLRFPDRQRVWGPLTRARLSRSLAAYLLVAGCGTALQAPTAAPALRAFGLGLVVPGGGFLFWAGGDLASQAGHVALALLSLAAVAGAAGLWFATGNFLSPFAVWLLTALGAGAMGLAGHPHGMWEAASGLVPLAATATLVGVGGIGLVHGRVGLARRRERNARLAERRPVEPVPAAERPNELSAEDLQLMRLLLDRALQPVERFDGFEWLDQFQTAAVRYQINVVSYALSAAQFSRTPAFQGYLTEAQRRLAAKQQDPRVWGYWRLENLWGNFRPDADPIPRDNIMFTGFLAAQLALFHAASGQRDYDAPESLVFEQPGRGRFAYDLPALARVIAEGHGRASLGLIACEPNWVYPLCNAIGAAGLRVQDNLTGTGRWAAVEPDFRRRLEEEFTTPAGDFVPCRSAYLGFALPQVGGAVGQAFPCLFLHAVLPAVAQRHWTLLREDLLADDFRRRMWRLDVGNYRRSRASSYAATAAAAVEMGDDVVARRLLQALDADHPAEARDGVMHRPDGSLWAHAVEFMARAGRAGWLRDIAATPPAPGPQAPHIAVAEYPRVLVASAVASDGGLRTVLHPGLRVGPAHIELAGLTPRAAYRCSGAVQDGIVADARGRAGVDLILDGRTELRVSPAS
jgi:hypothetical protein